MKKLEFNKLINKNKYQVFLFKTSLSYPLVFIKHAYFVTNKKGKINRFEILVWKNKKDKNYFHINYLRPTKGFIKSWKGYLIFLGYKEKSKRFDSELISFIEGGKGSIAEKMIDFIEKSNKNYKFTKKYLAYPGPNSNTFVQWIINSFPESKFKLPWNAFGKNYAKRLSA